MTEAGPRCVGALLVAGIAWRNPYHSQPAPRSRYQPILPNTVPLKPHCPGTPCRPFLEAVPHPTR